MRVQLQTKDSISAGRSHFEGGKRPSNGRREAVRFAKYFEATMKKNQESNRHSGDR
jgi:hypothetical protein